VFLQTHPAKRSTQRFDHRPNRMQGHLQSNASLKAVNLPAATKPIN